MTEHQELDVPLNLMATSGSEETADQEVQKREQHGASFRQRGAHASGAADRESRKLNPSGRFARTGVANSAKCALIVSAVDRAAIYGLLARVRDAGLELVGISRLPQTESDQAATEGRNLE